MGHIAIERPSLRLWLSKMIDMHDQLQSADDQEHAGKVKQLIEKAASGELIVAFCGHFSAGKSSLINALLGEPMLPSSPIPTSANLVKVKAGPDYVRVFFHGDEPVEYEPPYDPDLIRSQCRDGETIEWIEISRTTDAIPPGLRSSIRRASIRPMTPTGWRRSQRFIWRMSSFTSWIITMCRRN
nr:dynamin family protein [Geobacillus sp. JS12]